jgi:hypothetical protein
MRRAHMLRALCGITTLRRAPRGTLRRALRVALSSTLGVALGCALSGSPLGLGVR